MSARAQLSQDRSRQRREALLTAAVDLFVEGGSRAVTHRAVAAAAGLPAATTTYYFATIDDLLREALQHHITGWLSAMANLTETQTSKAVALLSQKTAVDYVESVFAARPASTATRELAVILGAARDPELRETAMTAMATSIEVMAGLLARAGVSDPRGLAEDCVAVIGGIALRRSAGVNSEAQEAANLVRAVRALIVGHLVSDEVARAALVGLRDGPLSGRSAESR